jgi:hypothetical protein
MSAEASKDEPPPAVAWLRRLPPPQIAVGHTSIGNVGSKKENKKLQKIHDGSAQAHLNVHFSGEN